MDKDLRVQTFSLSSYILYDKIQNYSCQNTLNRWSVLVIYKLV